jgi:hypothetical protein
MKPAGAVLTIVGLFVAALGIYLGLASVTRLQTGCGSGFLGVSDTVSQKDQANADKAAHDQDVDDLTNALEGQPTDQHAPIDAHRLANACQPAVDDRRTLALLVLVPGVALGISGVVLLAMSGRRVNE